MTKEEVLEQVRFHGELRGLSDYTVTEYRTKARMYQDYFDKPATELDISHVQQFIHFLLYERKLTPASVNTYNSGLRFLYNVVLDAPLNLHKIPCLRRLRRCPEIFSREEISALLAACTNLRDKAILMTLYGAGLRISEVACLRVADIDSENMQIYIRRCKGDKDRYALLSQTNLEVLREYWLAFRPTEWLFCALHRKDPKSHISVNGIQNMRRAIPRL